MSIAQVLYLSGGLRAGSPVPEEAAKMTEITKGLDGCERIYTMGNNQTGEGLVILVWRDREAMLAAGDHIAADNQALKDMLGLTLTVGPVYDNFLEM